MKNRQSLLISKMIKVCQKAGASVIRDFGELGGLSVESKGLHDFVSSADRRSEKIIAYELQQLRPEYHFLMEESGYVQTTSCDKIRSDGFVNRWVIDPIDGTTNFIRGNPNFVICVALEQVKIPASATTDAEVKSYISDLNIPAAVLSAMIYLPFHQEFYWAEDGAGAYHIDRYDQQSSLSVAARPEIGGAVVNTILHSGEVESFDRIFEFLSSERIRWRISGSIAMDMTYLASGKTDMVIFAEKLQRWDVSAAYLIAREAGVKIVDLDLQPINNVAQITTGMVAAHPATISKLAAALQKR